MEMGMVESTHPSFISRFTLHNHVHFLPTLLLAQKSAGGKLVMIEDIPTDPRDPEVII
jgi:hypothetical protein